MICKTELSKPASSLFLNMTANMRVDTLNMITMKAYLNETQLKITEEVNDALALFSI